MTTSANSRVLSLQGVSFDPSVIKRTAVGVDNNNKPPFFEELYDYTTFFYDAISMEKGAILVCPKLFNFEEIAKVCSYRLDGVLIEPLIRRYPRFDTISLKGCWPRELRISHQLIDVSLSLSHCTYQDFQGLNTLLTVSRNNDIKWIRDWIRYHSHHHKLEALLLFDNNSDHYSCSDLQAALQSEVLQGLVIVKAPFLYGPILRNREGHLLFLQEALFHIARLRFLRHCRAVASIDIDEIILPCSQSIFDTAARSPFGIIRFDGTWRYADVGIHQKARHGDHRFRLAKREFCPPKLAFQPGRVPIHLTISVHGLNIRNSFLRKTVHFFLRNRCVSFWHCYNLSTGWKGKRFHSRFALIPDQSISQALDNAGLLVSDVPSDDQLVRLESKSPLVRVVIPARNRHELLIRAIYSACAQLYVPLEIFVIDDASEPPLERLLPASLLSVITLMRQDKPTNAAYSRNLGASECRAPFLAFLDSDDLWTPYHLFDALEQLGSQHALFVSPTGKAASRAGVINDPIDFVFSGVGDLRTSSFVMPRQVFELVRGFDQDLNKHQDWDLAFRISQQFPLVLGNRASVILDHRAFGRMSNRIDLMASQRFFDRHRSRLSAKHRQAFFGGVARASLRQPNPSTWEACKVWIAENNGWSLLRKSDRVALRFPFIAHWLLNIRR